MADDPTYPPDELAERRARKQREKYYNQTFLTPGERAAQRHSRYAEYLRAVLDDDPIAAAQIIRECVEQETAPPTEPRE